MWLGRSTVRPNDCDAIRYSSKAPLLSLRLSLLRSIVFTGLSFQVIDLPTEVILVSSFTVVVDTL